MNNIKEYLKFEYSPFLCIRDVMDSMLASTVTGQNYFHTKIFSYIFHIKPLILLTFS